MPILDIGGRKVTVDDSFMSLSADEQNETVDEIAASLGVGAAEPEKFGGKAMNATAGLNEGLYGVLGAPADLMAGAMNLGIKGFNAATGSEVGTIDEPFGGSRSIGKAMGAVAAPLDPANTVATTTGDRIARGVGQGVAGTVLPAGLAGAALRTGAVSTRAAPLVEALAGRSGSVGAVAADAAAGGAAGAGGAVAQEVAPEKWKPLANLAGSMVGGGVGAGATTGAPALTRALAEASGNFVAPMSAAGRERLAGQRLFEAAENPRAAMNAIEEGGAPRVEGSQPTTFQQTGDMGLGALERNAQNQFPAQFQQRRAEQNAARRDALDAIQPGGAPEQVSRALKSRLDEIDAEASKDLDAARQWERSANRGLGTAIEPEVAGGVMRDRLQKVRDRAKEKEQALWTAVDPDGTLALPAENARRFVAESLRAVPASAKAPSGEEAAIYGVLEQYGDVVPFKELYALQSRVKTEMRRERMEAGETPAYARMAELNSSIFRDLESAAVKKVEEQSKAVARGEMREEDTFAAWLKRDAEGWIAERAGQAASGNGGARPVGLAGGSASSVSGVRGTAGQGARGSGGPQGDPRLSRPDLQPNFDDAALDRLSAARDATNARVNTFDNPTLRPMLKRPATQAPYDMRASSVPQRIFTAGTGAFEKIQTYRTAARNNPQAMDALEGYAIDSLRKAAIDRETGAVNPARLESWRRAHSDALRAFPELDIRIATASDAAKALDSHVARRKAALDEAQAGALGRLIGSEDPQDVVRTIGGLFSRQDAARQLGQVRQRVGDDKDALQGLRKAVAEHVTLRMVGNTEAATSGRELIKADQFQTFVKTNRNALRTVFDEREIRVMEAVAADLQQANRSLASVKIPNQSNTAQDQRSMLQNLMSAGMDNWMTVAGGTVGAGVGGPVGAAAGGGAAALFTALRQNGINSVDELVRDALLNPERARYLMTKVPTDPERADAMLRSLARRYVKAAAAGSAVTIEPERPKGPVYLTVGRSRPPEPGTELQRALARQ